MKVSIDWLKELIDLKIPIEELIKLLPLRTIGLKEVSENYFELDMKGYNRADLLSLRGVATEIAAITDSTVKFKDEEPTFPELGRVKVEIANEDLCPVYCVAKIENLKVENSNDAWVKKLNDSGIRIVNNIADITNLIMLEYGQPMHAFDEATVQDGTLIVRTAAQGEKLTTLDGKERLLDEGDLLIADPERALGLAGVMGGKNSEVTKNTTTILLEAAIFDPVSNRQTAKRHGLYSEATKRFQHGLTRTNLLQALDSAIKMYEGLGGKLTAITLTGSLKDKVKTINLTEEKINSLIGVEISPDEVESSLQKLGFKLETIHLEGEKMRLHLRGGTLRAWNVVVPYWRLDIQIEEDLIEEVARMYGYEKIPARELKGELPEKIDQSFPNFIYDLKKSMAEVGLTEVQTYSFYSTQVTQNLRLKTEDLLKIANPISSETEYMRDNLWPNLLETAAKNIRQGYKDIAIFEIGKVYLPRLALGKAGSPQKGDLPNESYHLSIALYNGTDNPIEELNKIAQEALKHLRGEKMQLHLGGEIDEKKFFHPTRFASIGENGWIAEIHPRFVNKFGVEQRVAVLEINLS